MRRARSKSDRFGQKRGVGQDCKFSTDRVCISQFPFRSYPTAPLICVRFGVSDTCLANNGCCFQGHPPSGQPVKWEIIWIQLDSIKYKFGYNLIQLNINFTISTKLKLNTKPKPLCTTVFQPWTMDYNQNYCDSDTLLELLPTMAMTEEANDKHTSCPTELGRRWYQWPM